MVHSGKWGFGYTGFCLHLRKLNIYIVMQTCFVQSEVFSVVTQARFSKLESKPGWLKILPLSNEETSASEGILNAYVSHLFLFTYIRLIYIFMNGDIEITMIRKSGTHLHTEHWTAVSTLFGLISSAHRDLHHWRSNQQPQYAEAETLPLGHWFMPRINDTELTSRGKFRDHLI